MRYWLGWPLHALAAERGYLFPWVPVCLATGIGLFFWLPVDPPRQAVAGLWVALLALAALGLRGPVLARPVTLGLALVIAGGLLAIERTERVAAPKLGYRYYGPVEGRIVAIDRSASDRIRLTLDQVRLARMDPDRAPPRVRVSLHGEQRWIVPKPGLRVMMTAHLSPPRGPVEPGGFDFERKAWFDRLGAVGYTRTPVLLAAPEGTGGAALWLDRLRMAISRAVQAEMPGTTGGFAAAILTGDRSAIAAPTLEALRASNLAHLLAISGLHMGLLTGFIFMSVRTGIALIPAIALRWPSKKIAAAVAIVAGAAYLALSGGNVATERAFIMVAVMLGAVLLDRRALTLRSVALAAIVVLVLRPEALLGPGFQMSFAATTALVAVFGALRGRDGPHRWRWLRAPAAVVISSGVAGFATAPIGAAHFNQIAAYGLLANLTSVPVMGILVMPAAVVAACLAPLGLAGLGLWAMHLGLAWILWVATTVAALEGAVHQIVSPPAAVLPILTLGALLLILWQGRLRWAGLGVAAAALALWTTAERPALLISDTGGLVGVMTPAGRALSKPRGDGFVASVWLENDGDPADQETAHGRLVVLEIGGLRLAHLWGKGATVKVARACAAADWVVITQPTEPIAGCEIFDPPRLRVSGAIAAWPDGDGLRVVTARDRTGTRVWNRPWRPQ